MISPRQVIHFFCALSMMLAIASQHAIANTYTVFNTSDDVSVSGSLRWVINQGNVTAESHSMPQVSLDGQHQQGSCYR
jgi:hypothetical protein